MGGKVEEYNALMHEQSKWDKPFARTKKLMKRGQRTKIWRENNEKARNTLTEDLQYRRPVTKSCPKCNIVVENLCDECFRMTCLKCKLVFCWICGIDVVDHVGSGDYRHDEWRANDPLFKNKRLC